MIWCGLKKSQNFKTSYGPFILLHCFATGHNTAETLDRIFQMIVIRTEQLVAIRFSIGQAQNYEASFGLVVVQYCFVTVNNITATPHSALELYTR